MKDFVCSTIFKIPFKGHEDTIKESVEEADENLSDEISMSEFIDAVAILAKKLGANRNRYFISIHGYEYSDIEMPRNNKTFAYECDALKGNGKIDDLSAIVIKHEERPEIGTVHRFHSILKIVNKLEFETEREYINVMLKLNDESEIFTCKLHLRVEYT